MNHRRVGRDAWLGVPFFVVLGALLLVLDPGSVIGWVSVAAGGLSGAWLGIARRREQTAADDQADDQLVGSSRPVPSRPARPFPALSGEGIARVDELVDLLAQAGVLAPERPEPWLLYPAVADLGEPVTALGVLRSLGDVGFWFPGTDPGRYTANLAHHETHVEQWEDTLTDQVADLARLAGGTAAVEVVAVRQTLETDGPLRVPTRIDLTVAGQPLTVSYLGSAKALSTVLHVELARHLRAAGAPRRIAGLWDDGALLLTGLPEQDLDRLDAALGLPPADPMGWGGWTWIEDTEPYAAGGAMEGSASATVGPPSDGWVRSSAGDRRSDGRQHPRPPGWRRSRAG